MKIKKKSTVILLFFLAFLLLFVLFKLIDYIRDDIYKNEIETIVGEIWYVDERSPKDHWYDIYLKLPNDMGNENLIKFSITNATSTEFEMGASLSEIPELNIGSIVEISYKKEYSKIGFYYAESLKTSSDSPRISFNPMLEINNEYREGLAGVFVDGKVIYIAKTVSPVKGYVVYLSFDSYPIEEYFIDEATMIPDDLRAKIENCEIGYNIKVLKTSRSPYLNYNCPWALALDWKN